MYTTIKIFHFFNRAGRYVNRAGCSTLRNTPSWNAVRQQLMLCAVRMLQSLNEALQTYNVPVQVVDGFIGSISVSIPWSALVSDNTVLEIHNLELTIQPRPCSHHAGRRSSFSLRYQTRTRNGCSPSFHFSRLISRLCSWIQAVIAANCSVCACISSVPLFSLCSASVPPLFRLCSVYVPPPSRLCPASVPPLSRLRPASVPHVFRLRPASVPLPSRLHSASIPPPSHLSPASVPPPSRLHPASIPPQSRLRPASAPPPSRLRSASLPPPSRLPSRPPPVRPRRCSGRQSGRDVQLDDDQHAARGAVSEARGKLHRAGRRHRSALRRTRDVRADHRSRSRSVHLIYYRTRGSTPQYKSEKIKL